MKSREIWLVDLDPTEGSEQNGIRPVIVISGNAMNDYSNLAIVCPLTTKIKNFQGGIVLEPNSENGLSQTSEILVFQVRTLSNKRFLKKLGVVPSQIHDQLLNNFIKICKY